MKSTFGPRTGKNELAAVAGHQARARDGEGIITNAHFGGGSLSDGSKYWGMLHDTNIPRTQRVCLGSPGSLGTLPEPNGRKPSGLA